MNRTLLLSALATMAGSALAIDFEAPTYNGSAGGTVLTGQDGWYLPVAGSSDWNVYTYAGNTHGFVANPGGGGDQFIAGVSGPTLNQFARAQRDFAWDENTAYKVTYDVNHQYLGVLPSAVNLGSWSLQNSATAPRTIQDLHNWDDQNTAATWRLEFNVFDAIGNSVPNQSPGAAWVGLLPNHWYRISHTISFVNNNMTETSITDLHTNTTNTFNPVDWYMSGGTAPILPMPTGYRWFAGGAIGNAMAIDNDNITVVPEPGTFLAIGAGIALLALRRRRN